MDDNLDPPAGATTAVTPPAGLTAPAPLVLALASGRSIEVTQRGLDERVEIRSTNGQVMLSVRLTEEGPVLCLSGVSLEIAASKRLALACDKLEIKAATDASIEVGGDLRERVAGNVKREALGTSTATARAVNVEAFPGGIALKANDDVAITGERVRLNSDDPPMPLTWEEHRARRALAANNASPEQARVAALLSAPIGDKPDTPDR